MRPPPPVIALLVAGGQRALTGLIAHAAWLGRPVALVGLPVFVVAIQPQLRAEAAALAGSFGDDYDSYRSEVPTWVRSPVRLRPRRQPLR